MVSDSKGNVSRLLLYPTILWCAAGVIGCGFDDPSEIQALFNGDATHCPRESDEVSVARIEMLEWRRTLERSIDTHLPPMSGSHVKTLIKDIDDTSLAVGMALAELGRRRQALRDCEKMGGNCQSVREAATRWEQDTSMSNGLANSEFRRSRTFVIVTTFLNLEEATRARALDGASGKILDDARNYSNAVVHYFFLRSKELLGS